MEQIKLISAAFIRVNHYHLFNQCPIIHAGNLPLSLKKTSNHKCLGPLPMRNAKRFVRTARFADPIAKLADPVAMIAVRIAKLTTPIAKLADPVAMIAVRIAKRVVRIARFVVGIVKRVMRAAKRVCCAARFAVCIVKDAFRDGKGEGHYTDNINGKKEELES